MIVYNTTVKISTAMAPEWLRWLNEEYAPQMLATGCFWKYQVLHLFEQDDEEGLTYAVQYYAHTLADYQTYLTQHAGMMQKNMIARWSGQVVSFNTVMRVVSGP